MIEESHRKRSINPIIRGSQKPKLLYFCDKYIKSKHDFPRSLKTETGSGFQPRVRQKICKSICYSSAPDSRIHQAV